MNFITFKTAGRLVAVTVVLALALVGLSGCSSDIDPSGGNATLVINNTSGQVIKTIHVYPCGDNGCGGDYAAYYQDLDVKNGSSKTISGFKGGEYNVCVFFKGLSDYDSAQDNVYIEDGRTTTVRIEYNANGHNGFDRVHYWLEVVR